MKYSIRSVMSSGIRSRDLGFSQIQQEVDSSSQKILKVLDEMLEKDSMGKEALSDHKELEQKSLQELAEQTESS